MNTTFPKIQVFSDYNLYFINPISVYFLENAILVKVKSF